MTAQAEARTPSSSSSAMSSAQSPSCRTASTHHSSSRGPWGSLYLTTTRCRMSLGEASNSSSSSMKSPLGSSKVRPRGVKSCSGRRSDEASKSSSMSSSRSRSSQSGSSSSEEISEYLR